MMRINKKGSVLCFVLITLMILAIFGFGSLTAAYGLRHRAVVVKKELAAKYAAEAGYEKAVYLMGQRILPYELGQINNGNISFTSGNCDYSISWVPPNMETYRVTSNGRCGDYEHTVSVTVKQETGFGNAIGASIVPSGPVETTPVYFATGEIIDMPIHINCFGEPDDSARDIFIKGTPNFLRKVNMGESRYSQGGSDKYDDVMRLFRGGINFDQPDNKITDKDLLNKKITFFKNTLQALKPELVFTPSKNNNVTNGQAAVQLEFYVASNGKGYVQITKDCTVRGYKEGDNDNTWDYCIDQDSGGTTYEQYNIYGYHYIPTTASKRYQVSMDNIQITPSYGGVEGQPESRIYVDGNVIIGSKEKDEMPSTSPLRSSSAKLNTLQGQVTIVATGNVWIVNDIKLDGAHDDEGRPAANNKNVLGIVAKGLVKIVDPGKVEGILDDLHRTSVPSVSGAYYEPVGERDSSYSAGSYHRHLNRDTVVEAALTVAGGGWGAENVKRGSNDGRKDENYYEDRLYVRGSICEAIRGVVGLANGDDGYRKHYYIDERLTNGTVRVPGGFGPGGLSGEFVPVPGGWREFSSLED
ncbi:MAG: hypothetical protein A2Y10_09700 [Planctomycetes bacterium GWF2_41_51]|nr:MAG: hypothetical protein A2Y10_09700 [Planctomycetes bacterium GWF2_41_51]HBG28253.1 hypothetical protein [Phycisphaerales bacterium]